jgi:hypothetical protein
MRVSKLAIGLSTLAICVTALLLVPAVTPAEAATGSGHVKKHRQHWRSGLHSPRLVGEVRPVMGPPVQTGTVCPGIGRSFDCKIWPPPYEEDPDRKTSRF